MTSKNDRLLLLLPLFILKAETNCRVNIWPFREDLMNTFFQPALNSCNIRFTNELTMWPPLLVSMNKFWFHCERSPNVLLILLNTALEPLN